MTKFPDSYDNDITLPPVNDNITEIGSEAINALRDAVIAIEHEIGNGGSGNRGTIANRIGVSIDEDGYIRPLALNVYDIVNSQIKSTADILESKLKLDYSTSSLKNEIDVNTSDIQSILGYVNTTGAKVEPHIAGTAYKHYLDHILVSPTSDGYFKNKLDGYRDNSNLYNLFGDINQDFVDHQKADGYYNHPGTPSNVTTLNGYDTYPSNFAHTASGIYINTSGWNTTPKTYNDLQKLADYIDDASNLLIGSRINTLFSSGISRKSKSQVLSGNGYGQSIVSVTPAITYLLDSGANFPKDNNVTGDDIIDLSPTPAQLQSGNFDAQFSLVKIGDVITVDYGAVETSFLVREKYYLPAANLGSAGTYKVRIEGKNLFSSTTANVRIDKSLFNINKYGVLSMAPAQIYNGTTNIVGATPSLTISSPRGAIALGNGFNPSQLGPLNFNLYLVLYPDGDIAKGIPLNAIDITGNSGSTPGRYTLESIVESANNSFRKAGYNYRFSAFSYNGEFGVMLADSYNNASFSIVGGEFNGTNFTNNNSLNNIISYDSSGLVTRDPLGFSYNAANIVGPKYTDPYSTSAAAAQYPVKMFVPLIRNNFYVDGAGSELDALRSLDRKYNLSLEPYQIKDLNGDGYWIGTVTNRVQNYNPTSIQLTYTVPHMLDTSSLAKGKTLVVQQLGATGNNINYGRFIIKDVIFTKDCGGSIDGYTEITLYDCVHNNLTDKLTDPTISATLANVNDNQSYALYFTSDSVTFNTSNISGDSQDINYKRHFEIYVDRYGTAFSHERARANVLASLKDLPGTFGARLYSDPNIVKANIVGVSKKLRGFGYGPYKLITLKVISLDASTGVIIAQLMNKDATGAEIELCPIVTGKLGQTFRLYDNTYSDYIDLMFEFSDFSVSFVDEYMTIQLFPSLSMDQEVMLIGSCQVDSNIGGKISYIKDLRQFGNISEQDLSTSAIEYLSAAERLTHANGIIKGFDLNAVTASNSFVSLLTGGTALVNGKVIQLNPQTINIPPFKEYTSTSQFEAINWALCVNDSNEYQLVAINNQNKVFVVADMKDSSVKFKIDSCSFQDLITKRKNLTPIHIINSNVTNNNGTLVYSISSSDVRRFIYNESLNHVFTWTDPNNELSDVGQFHSVDSLLNWLKYCQSLNSTVKVKGNITISGDLSLSQVEGVTFEGDNAVITINGNLNIGSKFTFKNIEFNSTNTFSLIAASDNRFIDCTLSKLNRINLQNGNTFDNCVFGSIVSQEYNSISMKSNNKFTSCQFDSITTDKYLVRGDNNNLFENCTFNDTLFATGGDSSSGGIELKDNNIIRGCEFKKHLTTSYGPCLYVGNNNIIDDIRFTGQLESYIKNLNSTDQRYAINIFGKNNLLNKLDMSNGFGIFVDYGSAINVSYGVADTLTQSNGYRGYNTISNCNFGYMNSPENGIYVNSSAFTFENNTMTFSPYNEDNTTTGTGAGLIDSGYGNLFIECQTAGFSRVNIRNNSFYTADYGDSINNFKRTPPCITVSIKEKTSLENSNITNNQFITSTPNTLKFRAAIAIVANIPYGSGFPGLVSNVNISNNDAPYLSAYLFGQNAATKQVFARNVVFSGNIFNRLSLNVSSSEAEYSLQDKLLIENNKINYIDFRDSATTEVISAESTGTSNIIVSKNNLQRFKGTLFTNDVNKSSLLLDSNIFQADTAGLTAIELYNCKSNLTADVCKINNNIIRSGGNNYNYGIKINASTDFQNNNFSFIITKNSISGIEENQIGIDTMVHGNVASIISNNIFIRGSKKINAYIRGNGNTTSKCLVIDNVFDKETIDDSNDRSLIKSPGSDWIMERNINQSFSVIVTPESGQAYAVGSYYDPTDTQFVGLLLGQQAAINSSIYVSKGSTSNPGLSFNYVKTLNKLYKSEPATGGPLPAEYRFVTEEGDVTFIFSVNMKNILPLDTKIYAATVYYALTAGPNSNSNIYAYFQNNGSIVPTSPVTKKLNSITYTGSLSISSVSVKNNANNNSIFNVSVNIPSNQSVDSTIFISRIEIYAIY